MNISGYIPSRQRLDLIPTDRSFEELAWGPKLMMARDEERQTDLGNINTALDFEYEPEDDALVEPVITDLRKEGDAIANGLATNPSDPQWASKIYNYKTKVARAIGPHGIIGRAVKNSQDIDKTWSEWDKVHKDDPLAYKNRVRESMRGTYKGMWNPDTKQYQGFEPGDAPNYYDVNKDIADALKLADGSLGKLVGAEGSSIKYNPAVNMFQVWNGNQGQWEDNSDAITGGATTSLNDWLGKYGTGTDRSKFAALMGYTPEYINNTVEALKQSQSKGRFTTVPGENTSYHNVPQDITGGGSNPTNSTSSDFLQYGTLETNVDKVNKRYDKWNEQLDSKGNIKPLDTTSVNPIGDARGAVSGLAPGFVSAQPTTNPREAEWKDLQTTYKNFYDSTHSTSGLTIGGKHYIGDKGFLELAKQADIAKTAVRGTDLGINNPQFSSSMWFLLSQTKDQPSFIKAGEYGQRKPSSLTKEEVLKKTKPDDLMYKVDADGRLKTIINGEEYIANPEILPRNVQGFDKNISELVNVANDFSLTKDRIDALNKTVFRVGNAVYGWVIDRDNPLKRSLYQVQVDQNGNYQDIPVDLSKVQTEAAKQKYMSAAPLKYKPEYVTE